MIKARAFLISDKLSFVLRLTLGAITIIAAVPKLLDIEKNSVYLVYSYEVFPIYPVNFARFLGVVVPYLELLIGLALIFGILTRLSAAGWGIISLVYVSVKLDIIFIQHRITPCGCFGGLLPHLLVNQSIWIDVFSILFCTQIIMASHREFASVRSLLPRRWLRGCLALIW